LAMEGRGGELNPAPPAPPSALFQTSRPPHCVEDF
jgi:hypothetical protein